MSLQTERVVPLDGKPARRSFAPLERLLDDMVMLVEGLDRDTYRARPLPNASGSIGEHVRHCLDHVSALAMARPSMPLSYDGRERGTAVETDPVEAIRQILQLKGALERLSTRSLDEPIAVTAMLSTSGESVAGWSTLARELAFVVSHTIHHQAMIGVLLSVYGIDTPDRFGHSPSTPRRH